MENFFKNKYVQALVDAAPHIAAIYDGDKRSMDTARQYALDKEKRITQGLMQTRLDEENAWRKIDREWKEDDRKRKLDQAKADSMLAGNPGLMNGSMPTRNASPDSWKPEAFEAEFVRNHASAAAKRDARDYKTPEEKAAEELKAYRAKKKADAELNPTTPKANIVLAEMDGDQGWGQYLVNKDSGATSYVGSTANNPNTNRTREFKVTEFENNMRKEFTKNAGDMALIFSIMKMYDPGSVVRESEFATAENARGVPDAVRQKYNKVLSGERLTPEMRQEFLSSAQNIYGQRVKDLGKLESQFEGIANSQGLNWNNVYVDHRLVMPEDGATPSLTDDDLAVADDLIKKYGGL